MSYNKTTWVDHETSLSAQNLNKIEQGIEDAFGGIEAHRTDYEYQTPTIVGTQIRIQKQSNTNILKFKLVNDVSGGNITISLDGGTTSFPLLDTDENPITELEKGFVEVINDGENFTLRPKGGDAKLKYDTFPSGTGTYTVNDSKIKVDSLVLINPISPKEGIWEVESQVGLNKIEVTENVSNSNTIPCKDILEITIQDRVMANTVASGLSEIGITYVDANVTEYNRTTPVTVINQAHSTEGNGSRKLVRLKNGWLVAVVKTPTGAILYRSTNFGETWSQNTSVTGIGDYAIESVGNIVYVLRGNGSNNVAITARNMAINSWIGNSINIDTSQSETGTVSIKANPQGTELHACWSSKNLTYPNSFNIRYVKGTINADGSVTWGSVEQITKINQTTRNILHPNVVIRSNGRPIIIVWSGIA